MSDESIPRIEAAPEKRRRKARVVEAPMMTSCSNCAEPMALRRRSDRHYCSKVACQRAKSKHYYQQRAETEANIKRLEVVNLVHALAHKSRLLCPRCGLTSALPGYLHPAPDQTACPGTGEAAFTIAGVGAAIWPVEFREYVTGAPS